MNKLAIQTFILFLFITGCTTGLVALHDLEYPLVDIQKSVDGSIPFGKRKVSLNGREFLSHYFLVKGDKYFRAKNAPVRYFAKVWVLGDRRPYKVEVIVYKEKRRVIDQQAQYYKTGTQKEIAKRLAKDIQKTLSKRRDKRNIIDDFRVF